MLLVRDCLVDRQQDVVSGRLSGSEQITIFSAFQSGLLRRVRIVAGKAVPEVDRQALIQEDHPHAIFASRESFASSKHRTALSRVTVGNCRKNSPSD